MKIFLHRKINIPLRRNWQRRTLRSVIVAGPALLALSAAAPSVHSEESDRRHMTTSQLEAHVPGTLISSDRSRSDVRSTGGGEIFRADGGYTNLADRAHIEGTYSIEEGRICISMETTSTRDCRVIVVEPPGELFFARPAPAPDSRPWPITVERLPTEGSNPN